jgi:hypothetical protein
MSSPTVENGRHRALGPRVLPWTTYVIFDRKRTVGKLKKKLPIIVCPLKEDVKFCARRRNRERYSRYAVGCAELAHTT